MKTTWTINTDYGVLTIHDADPPQRDNYGDATAWYTYGYDASGQRYLVRWDDLGDDPDTGDSADAADWAHPADVQPQ